MNSTLLLHSRLPAGQIVRPDNCRPACGHILSSVVTRALDSLNQFFGMDEPLERTDLRLFLFLFLAPTLFALPALSLLNVSIAVVVDAAVDPVEFLFLFLFPFLFLFLFRWQFLLLFLFLSLHLPLSLLYQLPSSFISLCCFLLWRIVQLL